MYLVKLGFTTNEKVKKSCLEDDTEHQIRKCMKAIVELKDINTPEKKAKYIDIKETIGELKEREKKVKALSYSEGFWTNLKTIIMA
jgi:DNA-directed RNA polymerase specialized sigma subunit